MNIPVRQVTSFNLMQIESGWRVEVYAACSHCGNATREVYDFLGPTAYGRADRFVTEYWRQSPIANERHIPTTLKRTSHDQN